MAVTNLAPMSEKPVLILDSGWVRLALEAEEIPRDDWGRVIPLLKIIHDARQDAERAR